MNMSLGENIQFYRRKVGVTQEQLASPRRRYTRRAHVIWNFSTKIEEVLFCSKRPKKKHIIRKKTNNDYYKIILNISYTDKA